jgi:hypothetical protein
LWSEINAARHERQRREELDTLSPSTCPRRALQLENRVLKALVLDLIVGAASSCSIDWFSDDRLRAIVLSSESD